MHRDCLALSTTTRCPALLSSSAPSRVDIFHLSPRKGSKFLDTFTLSQGKDATFYDDFSYFWALHDSSNSMTETCSRDLMPELPTCRPFGKAVNPGTLPREKYCTSFCIHTNAGQLKKKCFGGHASFSLVLFLPKPLQRAQKIKIQSHIERSLSPRRLQSILFFVTQINLPGQQVDLLHGDNCAVNFR